MPAKSAQQSKPARLLIPAAPVTTADAPFGASKSITPFCHGVDELTCQLVRDIPPVETGCPSTIEPDAADEAIRVRWVLAHDIVSVNGPDVNTVVLLGADPVTILPAPIRFEAVR